MSKALIKRIIACLVICVIAAMLFLPLNQFSFSNQNWLPKDNPIEQNKKYLDEEFNQGEQLVLLLQLEQSFFTQENFAALKILEARLKKIPDISRVQSPTNAKSIFKDSEGTLHNISYADAISQKILLWQDYQKHLEQGPYWQRLISSDTQTIAVVMTLDIVFSEDNADLRKKVYRDMASVLDASTFKNYYFSGETELLYRLDSLSKKDLVELLPITIFVLAAMLFLLYRQFALPLIVLSVVLLNLLVTFNLMQLINVPFNVLSANLPMLVLIIAMADSIHILRRWKANDFISNTLERCRACARETWLPCLFTSLTSAVGFGVFTFSEILPLKNFGELSFFSILLAYPVIMISNLLLLYSFAPKCRVESKNDLSGFLFRIITNNKKKIFISTMVLLLISVLVVPLAKTESNFLDVFFSPQSKTAKGFHLADDQLSGSGGIDIILQSEEGAFKRISSFEDIQNQVAVLQKVSLVNSVESLLEPIEMVHRPLSDQAASLPTTEEALAQEFLFLEFSRSDAESDVLSSSVDFLYQNSRIHLYTPNISSDKISQVLDEISPLLASVPYKTIVTGVNVYFQQLSQFVLTTQLSSMLLTGGVILLGFVLLFGLYLGVIGAIASFIPIVIVLGGQIGLKIPFDFATVLVASVSLGLCIDDTSHFLHRFKHYLNQGTSTMNAVKNTIADLQQPILITSLILLTGFIVLFLSELVVIQKFAWLTASAILLSLVMIFLLLPNMLLIGKSTNK